MKYFLSKTKHKKEALLAHLKKYTTVVAPQVAQIPHLLTTTLHPSASHSFSFKTVGTISTSSLFGLASLSSAPLQISQYDSSLFSIS